MPIVTADINSDYPPQLQKGSKIYSQSGFLIGVITDVVEQPDFLGDGAVYTPEVTD
jgi:hypothetical protein